MYQGERMNPPILFQFDQNYPVEHQYENTECGVYALYFIVQMLKDKELKYFLKHEIPDEEVFELRDKYFNTE